ncbi:MAG: hypothetical protein ACLQPN_15845 [Bryobacteraceae bacterium]
MANHPASMIEPSSGWITRRAWTRLAGAALLAAARWRGRAAALTWDAPVPSGFGCERRYRVDAQVVLLSVPLVRRAGVGAATAAWRESGEADGGTRILEFAAFSLPDRAAGLNRLGFIQERIRLAGAGMAEAIYFGLMTASAEESAQEARQALHSTASQVAYTAVDARIRSHSMETATAHFTAPLALSLGNRTQLERMARQALTAAPRQSVELAPDGESCPPFLQALWQLLRKPNRSEGRCIYNGRLYRLRLKRAPDPKAGEYFRARGLTSGPVIAVTGGLQRAGGKEIGFRLWVEESAAHPIPLRIEYQPRSYLRLAFEAEA